MMYQSQTADAKLKGDEGMFAAISAANLAEALRGATLSRLCARERMLPSSLDATGNQAYASNSNGVADALRSNPNGPVLGVTPAAFAATNTSESVRARVRLEVLQDPLLCSEWQVAVGLPDPHNADDALRALTPFFTKLRPQSELSYDTLQTLWRLVSTSAAPPRRRGITTLDLTATVVPSAAVAADVSQSSTAQPQQQQLKVSPEALEKLMARLAERYPLPTPKPHRRVNGNGGEGDMGGGKEEEEEDEMDDSSDGGADSESREHSAALRARCEQLQIPYTTYRAALREVALYEADVFSLLCQYLSQDSQVRVVLMGHNRIGATSKRFEGTVDLRALRALAAMIDANETLRVLDLTGNELGPNGVGIVAKALTKNIGLQEVDLSDNKLNAEPLEEAEDPTFTEEDPVFGERYAGLEAVSEVLKKNKFLRVLRLARNGIHAGDDLTVPADEDEDEEEGGASSLAATVRGGNVATLIGPTPEDVIASWSEAPFWKLLEPLQHFHRLAELDLRGNQLGVRGARMLATALHTNHSVRAIDLTDNGIGYRGLHYLADLVLSSPTAVLETLILQRNDLAGKSRNPSTQKKLRLKPRKGALAAMAALARALDGNERLRRLVLAENHLGPVLSATALSTIARAHALEELDFSWNEACGDHESVLDLTAAHYLAAALYPSTSLGGSGSGYHANANGGDDMKAAGSVPAHLTIHPPRLARLYLGGNNLCAAGLAALFPVCGFAPQHALRELDLCRNYVGNALAPLSALLRAAPTLDRLDLSYNHITTLTALLPGLRSNRSLTALDVSHNQLGAPLEERGQALPPSSATGAAAPTAMTAAPNAAGEAACEDVTALWQALAKHAALRDVDMSWNDFRECHARAFLSVVAYSNHANGRDNADAATAGAGAEAGARQEEGGLPAPHLARVDISNNPKIPTSVVRDVLEQLGSRPGMQVVSVSVPRPGGLGAVPANTIRDSGEANTAMPFSSIGGGAAAAAATMLATATVATDAEEEKLRVQTVLELIHTMAAVVEASPTLLDVSCGGGLLRGAAGAALSTSPDVEAAVEAMRRKLLLNALLTTGTGVDDKSEP